MKHILFSIFDAIWVVFLMALVMFTAKLAGDAVFAFSENPFHAGAAGVAVIIFWFVVVISFFIRRHKFFEQLRDQQDEGKSRESHECGTKLCRTFFCVCWAGGIEGQKRKGRIINGYLSVESISYSDNFIQIDLMGIESHSENRNAGTNIIVSIMIQMY